MISIKSINISLLLTLLIAGACSLIEQNKEIQTQNEHILYNDLMVKTENLPLFVDLSNLTPTKSTHDHQDVISLESLLNRDAAESILFKNFQITQIPFITNEDPSAAMLTESIPSEVNTSAISSIKLFLIEYADTLTSEIQRRVVTMIPDAEYMFYFGDNNVTFLDKSNYSGVVIFSEVDGTYRDVYIYGNGPIIDAEIINPSELLNYTYAGYLSLLCKTETKSANEEITYYDTLEASYCIAFVGERQDDSDIGNGLEDGEDSGINHDWVAVIKGGGGGVSSGGGGGVSSGGGSNNSGNPDAPTNPEFMEDVITHKIKLYSGMHGSTTGSGTYPHRSWIRCYAIPLGSSYVFDRWTGDFFGYPESIVLEVKEDVSSTAYFKHLLEPDLPRPCVDTLSGIMNPLINMQLAPTNPGHTNFKGSTFGSTRIYKGQQNFHSGIDLLAEIGTPIYAMHDGIISDYTYIVGQPYRDVSFKSDEWPENYIGDTNGAGNRIYIESTINGKRILIGLWHLDAGSPVAHNPRTGKPFRPGDVIFQGEIIAYTGNTGNAYNVKYKHLHLSIIDYDKRHSTSNSKYLNPEDFLNGQVQWNPNADKVVNSVIINNIKCHDISLRYDYIAIH